MKLENKNIDKKNFYKSYTMFESDMFFLEYKPVLTAFKELSDSFPMKKYIVYNQVFKFSPIINYMSNRYGCHIHVNRKVFNFSEIGDVNIIY